MFDVASVFQYAFVFQEFVLGSNITSSVYLRFLGIAFRDPLESHLLRKKVEVEGIIWKGTSLPQ